MLSAQKKDTWKLNGDVRTGGGECSRDGTSDAAGCAGDNGNFARKHFCIKNVHFIHL